MLMNRTTPFMVPVDDANPAIIKNEALCSECGHCFAVCEEEIGVAAKYLLNQREVHCVRLEQIMYLMLHFLRILQLWKKVLNFCLEF